MLSPLLRGLAAAVAILLALQVSSALADHPADAGPKRSGAARGHCKGASLSAVRLGPKAAANAVRCLINKRRAKHGLRPLRANRSLRKAARRHTAKMVASGCFAHECSGEPGIVGRLTSAGYLPCGCSWRIGENIGWGRKGRSNPAAIVKRWMRSPPHRATILTKGFDHVDVGVLPGKPGGSRARAGTYTADFGGFG